MLHDRHAALAAWLCVPSALKCAAAVRAHAQGAKPQEVVRMYDGLGQACKEMKDVAAQIGGANGELLMDEASAKVPAAFVFL